MVLLLTLACCSLIRFSVLVFFQGGWKGVSMLCGFLGFVFSLASAQSLPCFGKSGFTAA